MAEPVTLSIGDKAPDFKAVLTDGSTIMLSDMLATGRGVALFRHVTSGIILGDWKVICGPY